MVRPHHGDNAVIVNGLYHQRRLVDGAFDKSQISRSVDHSLRYLLRISDGQAEFYLGIFLVKAHQQFRQPIAGNGLTGLNA